MCGILGVLDPRGLPPLDGSWDPSVILAHRGPDGAGSWSDDRIWLGHRRLSIIDLETGQQPMTTDDGRACLIFNGEIYNYRELRRELESQGCVFRTHSDTEVILRAWEVHGQSCVERLRGMFAFALWDGRQGTLLLARDRLGIKPLYYAQVGRRFYFASEAKGILQWPGVPRELDLDALAAYFMLAYVPAPLTIYRGMRKLEPAQILTVRDGEARSATYWDMTFEPESARSEDWFIEGVRHHLRTAVRLESVSDVPVGAFLSGGIDSAAVVAYLADAVSGPLCTVSIGFGGDAGGHLDERVYARQVAERYSTRHVEYEVAPRLDGVLDEIVAAFDEPFGDPSVLPTYHVSRLARRHVKVAMSGLGGDELFGGYERHLGLKLSTLYDRVPASLRREVIGPLVDLLPERRNGRYTVNHLKRFARGGRLPLDERWLHFVSMLPRERLRSLLPGADGVERGYERCRDMIVGRFNSAGSADPLDRALYSDLHTYVPGDILACTDRLSMLHSLEVRVPFLDVELVEFCARIPSSLKIKGSQKKHLLRKALDSALPPEVLSHRKQGFIGPMTRWIRSDLKHAITEGLSGERIGRHGLFDEREVQRILDEHFTRAEIHDKLIWSMFMFQKWHERYMAPGGLA